MTYKERIAAIQCRLGLVADGVIGPVTLTAIEGLLNHLPRPVVDTPRMTCSLVGLNAILEHEISSEEYYNRLLRHPVWPGGAGGVTIGIGYDLGYCSAAQLRRDWLGRLRESELQRLGKVCRLKGSAARAKANLKSIREVTVVLEDAREVFYQVSLPSYAEKCVAAYPGVDKLPPDAQSAMLSLVLNRGTAKSGSRRREMKALEALVKTGDIRGMARQFVDMKRLWEGRGLDGLLSRRDREAALILGALRPYLPGELVRI